MLTVSLILAAFAIGAEDPLIVALPTTRVTLLREAGCWIEFEGDLAVNDGTVEFLLSPGLETHTLTVERFGDPVWKVVDFTIKPRATIVPKVSNSAANSAAPTISLTIPGDGKTAKIRARGFSAAMNWRAAYSLELGRRPQLVMRASVAASQNTANNCVIECIGSSATSRTNDERWSDPTIYELSTKRINVGSTSLVLFDGPAIVEQLVVVNLGGMAGEPGLRAAREKATAMVRLSNRSAKAWPAGELMVTNEGRLIARVVLPHTDAGQASEIALGAAVGVAVTRDEVELDRKAMVVRRETDPPDSILTTGSATISNTSGSAIAVRATKSVAGDATAASDDAKIVRTANRLGADQPLNEIRWNFTLPAGQSKRLTFGTSIRLPQASDAKDNRP